MRDYYGQPAFRRLLVWLNANDGSGYGCIELNTFSDTADFVNQLSKSCEKAVVEINYSRIRPDKNSELIVDGQQYLTIENFRRKYGDEAILVITHLDDIIDDMDDGETKALVNEINMNRENYVNYPSQILFVFRKAFMDKVFESAFDFTSMMGFHEDLTHISSSSIRLKNSIESYRPMPNREMLDIYRDDFLNEDMPINERMEAAKKYIDVCTYFYIRNFYSLDTINSMLLKFAEIRGRNERIKELEGEVYRLICSNPQIAKYFEDRIRKSKAEKMSLDKYEYMLECSEIVNNNGHNLEISISDFFHILKSNERTAISINNKKNGSYDEIKKAVFCDKMTEVLAREKKDYEFQIISSYFFSEREWEKNRPITAESYISVGLLRNNQGDYGKALDYFKKALVIQEKRLGRNHPDTAETYCLIGLVYKSQGNYGKALNNFEKALTIRENTELKKTQPYEKSGSMGLALSGTVKVEKMLQTLLSEAYATEPAGEHLLTAMLHNNIGLLYREQRDYAKALDNLKKALEIFQQIFSFGHPYMISTQRIVMDIEACMISDTHTKMRQLTLSQLMLPMKQ